MTSYKDIDISNYTDDFIRKAIFYQMTNKESHRKAMRKYFSKPDKRAKGNFRAKCYYWRVKKNNTFHAEYNPNGIKSE